VFTARYVLHSTFCPHSVFMCFVSIWEQTAIISLYTIDWLVFVTETQCVYCAVRSTFYVLPTRCIYVFYVDLRSNSDYFTVQHWLTDFCNRDEECLLRVTAWIFIYKSGYFQSFKCLMSLWNSVSCGLECPFRQGWVLVCQSIGVSYTYLKLRCVCCIESTDDYVSSAGIVTVYWLHNSEFNFPAMARDFSLMKIRPDWLWSSPKPPV
jgi:hypothetical protein